MSLTTPTVFVTSATGSLGMALCKQLREIGWAVHATTRNLDSPAAKTLASIGVKIIQGDWDNEEALKASFVGCDKLFINLMPTMEYIFGGEDSNLAQAERLLTLGKKAGVTHVIYSSSSVSGTTELIATLDPNTAGFKALSSKHRIENLVKAAGFQYWTILRPAFFMENFLTGKVEMQLPTLTKDKVLKTAWLPETLMALIDCHTIARFAIAAYRDPNRFHQQGLEIADEFLNPAQIAERLTAATGINIPAEFYTKEELEAESASNPLIGGQILMRQQNKYVNMERLKEFDVPLSTFKAFLEREKEAVGATYK